MAATITWTETDKPTIKMIINDDAMASLEQARLSQTAYPGVGDPVFPDVLSMLLSALSIVVIQPAFKQFPPVNIQTAAATAAAAVLSLAQAESAFITSAMAVTP